MCSGKQTGGLLGCTAGLSTRPTWRAALGRHSVAQHGDRLGSDRWQSGCSPASPHRALLVPLPLPLRRSEHRVRISDRGINRTGRDDGVRGVERRRRRSGGHLGCCGARMTVGANFTQWPLDHLFSGPVAGHLSSIDDPWPRSALHRSIWRLAINFEVLTHISSHCAVRPHLVCEWRKHWNFELSEWGKQVLSSNFVCYTIKSNNRVYDKDKNSCKIKCYGNSRWHRCQHIRVSS